MDELTSQAISSLAAIVGTRKAERVLREYQTLNRIFAAPVAELRQFLTDAQAVRLAAVGLLAKLAGKMTFAPGSPIRTARDVFEAYSPQLTGLEREQFRAVFLNGKNRVITEMRISEGSLTSSIVHPREVFTTAVRVRADAVVFVHNHPSGDPTPSLEDLEITRRLVEVSRVIGIKVLDHIVIGDGEYASFHEKGILDD